MNCPACGCPDVELVEVTDIPGDDYTYWLCQACGAEFDNDGEVTGYAPEFEWETDDEDDWIEDDEDYDPARPPVRCRKCGGIDECACSDGPEWDICANWGDHHFEEEYYGHRCTKCGLFFPHGGAPWDDVP